MLEVEVLAGGNRTACVGRFGTIVVALNIRMQATRGLIDVSGSVALNVAITPKSEERLNLEVLYLTFCLTSADLQNGLAWVVRSEAAGAGTARTS